MRPEIDYDKLHEAMNNLAYAYFSTLFYPAITRDEDLIVKKIERTKELLRQAVK